MVDKTETINLEELLNSLDSDQGRVTAIGNLLHINAIDIPLKFVDFAIHYYEKAGLFKDAAKVANEAKIAEKAKELYAMAIEQRKKKDDFFGAGHIAEEAGNLFFFHADKLADKSRMDKPAKSAYKSDLNEIAKQFYLVAIENYKKEGVTCSNSAAELAKRIGGATKKIEVYEDMHQYEDAIRAAEEANMNYKAIEISLRAIQFYEDKNDFFSAAKIASKAGMLEKAIDNYEKSGNFLCAADAAEKAGMPELAMLFYENAGRFDSAAQVAFSLGMSDKGKVYSTIAKLSSWDRK